MPSSRVAQADVARMYSALLRTDLATFPDGAPSCQPHAGTAADRRPAARGSGRPVVARRAAGQRSPHNDRMRAAPPYALVATRARDDLIAGLSRRWPKVPLHAVLADLDRAAERCAVPARAAGPGFTWDPVDREDRSWWPQGVASVRSGAVLLVSWYSRRRRLHRSQGSRISVLDPTSPAGPRYRHLRLVRPRRRLGLVTMGNVRVHVGGIAVLGDRLHVADTVFGVRVFRLEDILRVPRRPLRARAGAWLRWFPVLRRSPAGNRGADGYEYVLPQLMAYRVPLRLALRGLRYSFLSIGTVDGRPHLVVGEYRRKGQAAPRLARYPLDPGTGLPTADRRGRAVPLEVYEHQPRRMQGVAVQGSTWFVTASAGEGVDGDLYVGAPGEWVRHRGVLPTGPEDLDWSPPGNDLWCVSEWPGRRWVFPSRWAAGQRRKVRAPATPRNAGGRADRPRRPRLLPRP